MLIAFMCHLELCFEIKDKEVLEYVSKAEQNPDPNGRYLFFPGLIRIDIPERLWEDDSAMSYHFGWILECSQDIQFFDHRCLQVLILRLVFTFGLAPASKVRSDIPSLQRFCSVWKSGIYWCSEDGVMCHLELSENGKSFAVKVRSRTLKPSTLLLRLKLINQVLKAVKHFCPSVESNESIIDPEQVIKHPLKPASSLTLSTVSDTAVAIVSNKDEVKSMYSPQSLQQLLQFEPYAGLDSDTLQNIHSEKSIIKNDQISNGFISYFANQVADPNRAHMYRGILSPRQASSTQAFPTGSPTQEVVHSLERWTKETEGTYTCLRETLNKYSVFTGRNPLDMAGVAHSEVDSHLSFPDPSTAESQQATVTELLPLDKVREVLKEVRSDWYSLAVELDIDYGTRKAIEKDNSSVEAKFDAMSQHWVRRTSPPPTWAALVRALRSPAVDRGDVAIQIQTLSGSAMEFQGPLELSAQNEPRGPTSSLNVNKDLKVVRAVTWEARALWDSLGVQLDVSEGTIKAINDNNLHARNFVDNCYTALLESWLTQTTPPASLAVLIEALKSPVIDRSDIARKIEAMFQ